MHIVFMPYGIKHLVDYFGMQLQCEKFACYATHPETKERRLIDHYQGSLRILPGGVWEYIIPVEDANRVMTTLNFHVKDERYKIPDFAMKLLRKVLKLEKIPDYDPVPGSQRIKWIMQHVAIIPLGVRYDAITKEEFGKWAGWEHEAL